MKQITKQFTVYSFDELSEKSQEKAIEKLRYINVDDEWWDVTYEDAKTIGLQITGFDTGRSNECTGKLTESAYEVSQAIMKEHGDICGTYKLAQNYIKEWDELVKKYSDGVNTDQVAEGNEYEFDEFASDLEDYFLQQLLEEYLIILRDEYEYLTSDEAIAETIRANEYEFLEDGTMY